MTASFSTFAKFRRGGVRAPSVLFVKADWCPHCHSTAPAVKRAQKMLGPAIPVYAVDADVDKNAVAELGVKGFPTIIVVGTDRKMREYTGPRDPAQIAAFARRYV